MAAGLPHDRTDRASGPGRAPGRDRWLLAAAAVVFAGVIGFALWQQTGGSRVPSVRPLAAGGSPSDPPDEVSPPLKVDAGARLLAADGAEGKTADGVESAIAADQGIKLVADRDSVPTDDAPPAAKKSRRRPKARLPEPPPGVLLAADEADPLDADSGEADTGESDEEETEEELAGMASEGLAGDAAGALTDEVGPGGDPQSDPQARLAGGVPAAQVDLYVPQHDGRLAANSNNALKFKVELQALLAAGLRPQGADLDEVRERHRAVGAADSGDPRLDYALAVVLAADGQAHEAREALQASLEKARGRFAPARGLSAWLFISRGDLEKGAAALLELARAVFSSADDWPLLASRDLLAQWMGRVVGYVKHSGRFAMQSAEADRLDPQLRERLDATGLEAYERGLAQVADACATIAGQLDRTEEELAADAAVELARLRTELAEAREEHEQWLQTTRGALGEIETKYAEADRQWRELTKASRLGGRELDGLSSAVRSLSQPRFRTERRTRPVMDRDGGRFRTEEFTVRIPETEAERQARLTQLAQAQQQYAAVQLEVVKSRNGSADMRKERDRLRSEFRNDVKGREPELQKRTRHLTELATRTRYLEETAITHDVLREKLHALGTFVPFDPFSERHCLLESLKRKPDAK